ncbi:1-acyl-sn-glycerol-3-phosphate acyltransferase [Nostoc sp. UHCC 0252]|uniref:1-acyl-sn-glycerol-3-phosphate acyltransferase n=1 Tax=Nostoc sp. UHCC 0252 TaxID=3110241 RepID=UPI002B1EE0AF|nr:1-acyl-sn-glycerol-3-phosphate acyltransferase [Nostoc sp. UHCC 0252]MEA5603970.1 1-acyl-sn-glycerol-3-phosphate acyltransferase [Nostoc sp. UHCC 0252]
MSKKQHLFKKKSGWSLDERDPKFIESLMPLLGFLYQYYFQVKTSGWENISPKEKVLFVGSHNGGLAAPDMTMMMYDWFRRFGVEQPIYGLMHPKVWQVSLPMAQLAAKAGAIAAHPKMAYTALREASLLVYPGGAEDVFRPHYLRNKIYFAGRKGFIKLALRANVPIVPVISWGAHDTLIVLADFYKIVQQLHEWGMPWLLGIDPEVFPIYLGLPWGLAIGPLPNIPLPVPIYTQVCPPIVFERYGTEAASDRHYVNECYELVVNQMQQELDSLVQRTAKLNTR